MNIPVAILILCLPLLSFVLGGLGGAFFKRMQPWLGSLLVLAAAVMSYQTAYYYFFEHNSPYENEVIWSYSWLDLGKLGIITIGFELTPLSTMMLVVVTTVSSLVHCYSIGYMKGDERVHKYYAFLGLFTFSMLGLVVADSIFQVYIFWELVGVSSFLLIGYFTQRVQARAAALKAFVVTRFADFFFLIGILILSNTAGSFNIDQIVASLSSRSSSSDQLFLGLSTVSIGLTLVFIGGAGKSALFPLHIWLPDAMEGPTPVSALIHAATMVVAGVFLVARFFPIYQTSPVLLEGIGYIGAITSLIAALIACTQTDIKRILAYSTMSQIGYMMAALGVAGTSLEANHGYTASLFHLFTHAFFKALLFLCAGTVIHAVHSNEVKDMGGLRKELPLTHLSFLIGCLAISGVPFLSGFFSKEMILSAAYEHLIPVYYIELAVSGLTAFYMFRLYFLIFWNQPFKGHAHDEGSWTMKLPLILLSIAAIGSGYLVFSNYVTANGKPFEEHLSLLMSVPPVLIGLGGIVMAWYLYKNVNGIADLLAQRWGFLYRWAYHKFYIDECYRFFMRVLIFTGAAKLLNWIDTNFIDGLVLQAGESTEQAAERIKKFQSGRLQQYAFWLVGGVVILLAVLFFL